MNNLAIAYSDRMHGERAENVEQAISYFQQVLEVYARQDFPEDWATTQNNLGEAYRKRIRGEKAENLEQAILYYQQALEVLTRQANPEKWAGTHNNLVLAYYHRMRGERADNLERIIYHCEQALKVYTPKTHPEDCAVTQARLVTAREELSRGDRKAKVREMHKPLTYPQFYSEESRQQPGEKRNLKLIESMVPDFGNLNCLILVYQWGKTLSDEATKRLGLRAVAYVACAIYDAATSAGLSCQASDVPHGRRPAWIIEGERAPISLTLSEIDDSDRTCRMTIGASAIALRAPPSSRTHWERLQAGFKDRFSIIRV